MDVEAILGEDDTAREAALRACGAAREHERSGLAAKLALIAKDEAAVVAAAEENGATLDAARTRRLRRACLGLSRLRVEVAKAALVRIADEGTVTVKEVLTEALRETPTAEGRAVLVYLLSDDDTRRSALMAIAAAPWPGVLPTLIELAEAEDQAARLTINAIARCGATSGVDESCAAADFLFELLDDENLLPDAFDAVLRHGHAFPGLVDKARRLAKEPGPRKAAGVCLFAACGTEGTADLIELALSGAKVDKEAARVLIGPLMKDSDDTIRSAAERTWRVLDLR